LTETQELPGFVRCFILEFFQVLRFPVKHMTPRIKRPDTSTYPRNSAFLSSKGISGLLIIGMRFTSRSVIQYQCHHHLETAENTEPSIFAFICVAVV
jgi:hypothetical protein